MLDLFMIYQFIRRLATPFKDWEAFKLGIIDERGTILKKRRELRNVAERNAFGLFDIMLLNIKKLIERVPGGQSRLASYAAALYLIREGVDISGQVLNEDVHAQYPLELMNDLEEHLNEVFNQPYSYKMEPIRKFGPKQVSGKTGANFKPTDGSSVDVVFDGYFLGTSKAFWHIDFARDEDLERTGTGDEFRIFATILDIIEKFLDQEKPRRLKFSSSKENEGAGKDSRTSLYTRMVKTFASKKGYKFDVKTAGPETIFTLTNTKLAEDGPTTSTGSGAVAGMGVGPDGEPGLTLAQVLAHRRKNKKRKEPIKRDMI
ncbi:MAG: hypothetical protein WCY93_08570 [Anaerolineaceae bacterium]